jgi:hypothetical protein
VSTGDADARAFAERIAEAEASRPPADRRATVATALREYLNYDKAAADQLAGDVVPAPTARAARADRHDADPRTAGKATAAAAGALAGYAGGRIQGATKRARRRATSSALFGLWKQGLGLAALYWLLQTPEIIGSLTRGFQNAFDWITDPAAIIE